jgi:hypothetical protein
MAGRQRSSLHLEKGSWRLEARTTAAAFLVLILLGTLSWLCLSQASKVSTTRRNIWEKEAEIKRLQRENAQVLAEVVELISVSHLESMALGLGYAPAEDRRYLEVPDYPIGASGIGLALASGLDESAPSRLSERPAPQESTEQEEGSGVHRRVARWWEKVLSQFTAWARMEP